jgi:dolichyl-phosphate-mannose--protein O-mannosyl transferase
MDLVYASPLTSKKKPITESTWLKTESMRQVMISVVTTQGLVFAVMVLMLLLLFYEQSSKPLLLAWFTANGLLSALRWWFLRGYTNHSLPHQFQERVKYFLRYAKLAPFNGLIWGLSVYLFNNTASPNIAIFCLIIVLVFGMFSPAIADCFFGLSALMVWA